MPDVAGDVKTHVKTVLALDDQKAAALDFALKTTEKTTLSRRRWQFLRDEGSFTSRNGLATYNIKTELDNQEISDRYFGVRIAGVPIKFRPPHILDAIKSRSISTIGTETVVWTIRKRENKQKDPLIELWPTPLEGTEIVVQFLVKSATDYLCEYWPQVMISGMVACLRPGRRIITPTGAVIEEPPLGQPHGDPAFEKNIQEMIANELAIPFEDAIPLDSQIYEANMQIYNADPGADSAEW